MVKKTKDAKTSKRRTQVKNLSKSGWSLTTTETKKVKGGRNVHKNFQYGGGGSTGKVIF